MLAGMRRGGVLGGVWLRVVPAPMTGQDERWATQRGEIRAAGAELDEAAGCWWVRLDPVDAARAGRQLDRLLHAARAYGTVVTVVGGPLPGPAGQAG